MKQKPRWTLEMLTGALAVLCALLTLVLLVYRPAYWPVLAVLVVLWGVLFVLFRCRLRSWVARWVCGGSFEKSKTQFSLEPLSQPAALLSGETVLWYNTEFRTRLMKGEALLVPRVQKVLPGLDLQEARKVSGQLLNLADGVWSAHSSTVPGEAESMTLLVLNEETALRKVEAEYKASRPGYLVFLVDGYDDVFSDMLDSERARLLEGINRVLEDMIGRGTGFLRRVASGRYIAVVEERQLEQFAKRGYDVLDKIRALDPSVNLSISIGIGRGAKPLRRERAVQPLGIKKQVVFIPEKACGQDPPLRLCFLQRSGKVGKNGLTGFPAQNGMKGAAADGGIGQRCRQCAGHNIPLLYLVIILYCTMPGQQKICGIV